MSRLPDVIERLDANRVRWRGRKLLFFGGCDYFRLSRHPRVLRAAGRALRETGLSVSASRLTTGNHPLYSELETALARFFSAGSAVVVANGYATNLIVAQALAGKVTHVFLDAAAHPSLVDAAGGFEAPIRPFRHCDLVHVRALARRLPTKARPILLTDGLFASDGTVAPLREYLRALPRSALLLVDDAHGAGVLGKHGRGSLEHESVPRDRVIQTITLSKTIGGYGGAILGSRALKARIVSGSRMFIGSTPPPLPAVRAALESLAVLKATPSLRQRLQQNAARVRHQLRNAGVHVPDAPGPIIAITPARPAVAARLQRALLDRAILPPFVRYPGSPNGGHFRFVISSEHTRPQLDALTAALASVLASSSQERVS